MPIAAPSTAAISGFSKLGELADEAPTRRAARVARARRGGRGDKKIADVVAGGEDAALAADDKRADARVALGLVEGLDQRLVHRAGDRVLLLRPGERRSHHRAVAADVNSVAHALSAKTVSYDWSGAHSPTSGSTPIAAKLVARSLAATMTNQLMYSRARAQCATKGRMARHRKMTRLTAVSAETIAAAAACLRAGGLVAMPTETVYGLAADATSDAAVAAIFAAKQRPAINPLIAHVLDIETARQHAVFGDEAEKLARAFWPGPLTLVLPAAATSRVSLLARAGLDTVALRAPSHETARALIEAAGVPLAAPSANRSGRVSPTTAAHVLADLDGKIDWILDAGPSRYGLKSTIVACLARSTSIAAPRSNHTGGDRVRARFADRLGSRVPNGAESAWAIGVALCSQRCSSTGSRGRCGR